MSIIAPLITPTQSDAFTSMRAFIQDVSPGMTVRTAQQNRVAEPKGSFVMMSPLRIKRLGTNRSTGFDVKFTGSVAGNVLTVTAVKRGKIILNSVLFGVGLENSLVRIQSAINVQPDGTGTYQLSASPDLASETLSAGYWQYLQPAELTIQLDFHSTANSDGSADMTSGDLAQAVSTLFRSDYGVRFFAALGPDVTPLYADDPSQRPFTNDQNQVEFRWGLDACMQVNDISQVGQQFADSIVFRRVMVDAPYPS